MKTMKLLFLVLAVFINSMLYCQSVVKPISDSTETEQYVIIKAKSGGEFIGVIEDQTKDQVILKTELYGTMTFDWKNISSIENIDKENIDKKGVYSQYNLQSTRYFFGPNGFGLKKGEGYYQNVWIFFNQASYGFTDYFSVSAGVVPLFLFAGTPSPIWIAPKFSIPLKKDFLNFGVGGLFGTVLGDGSSFGIGYGTFTLGNRDHNLSVSLGWGMIEGEWSSSPVITVSGMTRVSKKTYLLTENYFLPDNITLLSFGGRSFAGKVGIDYGLFFPLNTGLFIGIPWFGLTIPFGNY